MTYFGIGTLNYLIGCYPLDVAYDGTFEPSFSTSADELASATREHFSDGAVSETVVGSASPFQSADFLRFDCNCGDIMG